PPSRFLENDPPHNEILSICSTYYYRQLNLTIPHICLSFPMNGRTAPLIPHNRNNYPTRFAMLLLSDHSVLGPYKKPEPPLPLLYGHSRQNRLHQSHKVVSHQNLVLPHFQNDLTLKTY